ATITDPLGHVTANSYDSFARLISSTTANGTPDAATTHYEYDLAGNVTAVVDPDGHRTDYTFDAMNRQVLIHDALGHDTQFTSDASGNILPHPDARGNVSVNIYDAFGRLLTTTGPDPDGPGPLAPPVTSNSYDPAGNRVVTVDPSGHPTNYAYDARR